MIVRLANTKITKNMVRFEEVDDNGNPCKTVFGGIAPYINKTALKNPNSKGIIIEIKEDN